ncbi:sensor domain-containing diguanylate cyclase [Candidatus Xianfuyuplasma coldseepsis]|uniref:GGDEF domain-containing protein n=1 Tax=Candidatus Xianfuyuplasma coldseepsis TaxID=2782163 RepID=A0A7L7KPQ5_9MOLU|nr:sensor domain-containing diguanylate cyclase [Xianfuyuplasma coldseepsis]QMS84693.1 GGDEF domain-containing protein [Xianfuyuplasma coldseepsis]
MRIWFRNTKRGLLYTGALVLLFVIIIFTNAYIQYNIFTDSMKTRATYNMQQDVELFNERSEGLTKDFFLLKELILNNEAFAVSGDTIGFVSEDHKTDLQQDFVDWVEQNPRYDQIRIIDVTGMEILRVNCNCGDTMIVDDSELQNKADRYYFQDAVNLEDTALYFSSIDLNIENGELQLIDGEPVPMIRLASPLYNSPTEQVGIVIINYKAQDLFHLTSTLTNSLTEYEVLNEDGYFLYSSDKDREFGFMYEDGTTKTFDTYYDIDLVQTNNQLYQEIQKGTLYTYITITSTTMMDALSETLERDIPITMKNDYITLFTATSIRQQKQYQSLTETFTWVSIFGILGMIIIARLADEIYYVREKNIAMLRFTANHDALTTLPNREFIMKRIQYLTSRQEAFTVLFADLNKFKAINDTFGHDVGDRVLIECAKRFTESVREDDIVSRLGGDEFIIVLLHVVDIHVIERIIQTIKNNIKKPMSFNDCHCDVGVSIGYSIQDGSKEGKDLVHDADEEMYHDKQNR